MKRNQLAAALIAGTTFLWACGNNNDREGSNMTTGERTLDDSATMGNTTGTGTTGMALDTMDQNFAMRAASSDMLEIQTANMAMQNGNSERVKSFATMMIRDHGQTSEQLKSLASGKNVTIPADMLPEHRDMMTTLQGKTGRDFDRAYMEMNVKAHQAAVDLFQRASANLRDTEMKNFASQHLPHLRMHLDSAQAISKNIR